MVLAPRNAGGQAAVAVSDRVMADRRLPVEQDALITVSLHPDIHLHAPPGWDGRLKLHLLNTNQTTHLREIRRQHDQPAKCGLFSLSAQNADLFCDCEQLLLGPLDDLDGLGVVMMELLGSREGVVELLITVLGRVVLGFWGRFGSVLS